MQENGDQLRGTMMKYMDECLPPVESLWQEIGFQGEELDAPLDAANRFRAVVIWDMGGTRKNLC